MAVPSDTPKLPPGEVEKAKIRGTVEKRLFTLSQDLYELEICAGSVVKDKEHMIPDLLQKINTHFVALNDLSRQMQPPPETGISGDSVPRNVAENVDGYRNPHSYTKNTLSRAVGENQYALGRILGLESFRRQLEEGLGKELPDVPLPVRQHRPVIEGSKENGTGAAAVNGESSADDRIKVEGGSRDPEVKNEEQADGGVAVSNGT